jgi:hypothetical protein
MNPVYVDASVKPAAPLTSHEREALVKRLAQINVALGHPTWTAGQLAAFVRERATLERTLAANDAL